MDISRKDFLAGLAALCVAPLAVAKGLAAPKPPPLRFADIAEVKKRLGAHEAIVYRFGLTTVDVQRSVACRCYEVTGLRGRDFAIRRVYDRDMENGDYNIEQAIDDVRCALS